MFDRSIGTLYRGALPRPDIGTARRNATRKVVTSERYFPSRRSRAGSLAQPETRRGKRHRRLPAAAMCVCVTRAMRSSLAGGGVKFLRRNRATFPPPRRARERVSHRPRRRELRGRKQNAINDNGRVCSLAFFYALARSFARAAFVLFSFRSITAIYRLSPLLRPATSLHRRRASSLRLFTFSVHCCRRWRCAHCAPTQ